MKTVKLEVTVEMFEKIATLLEGQGFLLVAKNYGCDDDDYSEVTPEDRTEDFDPSEYDDWQVWQQS